METNPGIVKSSMSIEADSTSYMLNKYEKKRFSYEQICFLAIGRQQSKENPDFDKYESCYAQRHYKPEAMLAIYEIIKMGIDPTEYIVSDMTSKEVIDIYEVLAENQKLKENNMKEGIYSKIERLKSENEKMKNEKTSVQNKQLER